MRARATQDKASRRLVAAIVQIVQHFQTINRNKSVTLRIRHDQHAPVAGATATQIRERLRQSLLMPETTADRWLAKLCDDAILDCRRVQTIVDNEDKRSWRAGPVVLVYNTHHGLDDVVLGETTSEWVKAYATLSRAIATNRQRKNQKERDPRPGFIEPVTNSDDTSGDASRIGAPELRCTTCKELVHVDAKGRKWTKDASGAFNVFHFHGTEEIDL